VKIMRKITNKKPALLGAFFIFFTTYILFLNGCSGVKYNDSVQAIKLLNTNKDVISSRVLANAIEWRNSGVLVTKGNLYQVNATGRWRLGGLCNWTGPDGLGAHSLLCPHFDSCNIVNGWTGATLVAKIGESDLPFVIGNEYEFEAKTDGVLYFRINEKTTIFDNEGFVTVKTILKSSQLVVELNPDQKSNQIVELEESISVENCSNWAVIIGISQYQHSGQHGLANLIFADDDAKAFAQSLRNLGWSKSHIKLLLNEDATQRNIMIALESWLSKAGPNDQIVLFWAGHGFPDPEDPEKVYFACYDTNISIPATGYRMDKVRTALEERKSKNVILLADTCHAGKLITRGERGISIVPQIDKMQREQQVPKGWVFMVGADTDRKAIEHTSWTNGAFTHSLIKGLSGEADGFQSAGAKDGIVTMGELKDYMNISMPDETQKVLGVAKRPVITTSTGDPDIWNLTLQVKK
jgi:hypothetical protein